MDLVWRFVLLQWTRKVENIVLLDARKCQPIRLLISPNLCPIGELLSDHIIQEAYMFSYSLLCLLVNLVFQY